MGVFGKPATEANWIVCQFSHNLCRTKSISLQEITEETNHGETLQAVKKLFREMVRDCQNHFGEGLSSLEITSESSIWDVTIHELILRESQIVIPYKLQNRVVTLAHWVFKVCVKLNPYLERKCGFLKWIKNWKTVRSMCSLSSCYG